MTISQLPELTAARAHELIDRFMSRRITVVGDVMLDRFLIGRVSRMSPEAPVPVVVHDHDEFRLGGAANVANNPAGQTCTQNGGKLVVRLSSAGEKGYCMLPDGRTLDIWEYYRQKNP